MPTFQSTAQSSGLPHPVLRRAARAGTVGLRNRASSSPVREKGDKVFGERCRATTDGFSITDFFTDTDAEEVFPNDDYFPDINTLFNDDMGDNINANTNGAVPAPAPYVIFLYLLEIMLQTVLMSICLDLFSAHSMVDYMTSLISNFVMFYLLLLWIKSCGKLLIYPTYSRQGDCFSDGRRSRRKVA